MQEKKQYLINKQPYVLKDFEVAYYRKIYGFIAKNNLKKFYRVVDDKYKIEVGEMIQHLVMSNLLDKFLSMILEPSVKCSMFDVKCLIRKIFRINPYKHISDEVLVEVLADFFTGKLQLWTGLMKGLLPFLQNLNLPLNKLEDYQV